MGISNIRAHQILHGTRCFVLDMDGTIYLGDRLFPYTRRFLDTAERLGRDCCFFTNNSSKDTASYVNKLHGMGIAVAPDRVLISNGVCIRYLQDRHSGKVVYLAGTPLLEAEFLRSGIPLARDSESADLGVFGFDTTLHYEKLRILCDIARTGRPVLGVNPDYNCPVEGGYIPDCGSIGALITRSTGIVPEYLGKPSPHALRYIVERTGCPEREITVIGDRLYTDIALAAGTEAKSILVLSGEATVADVETSGVKPDLVCRDLDAVTDLLIGAMDQ